MPVAQDLHFDVLGAAHEALQEDGVVAEGGGRFAARLFELAGEILRLIDHAHAASAAAERGFDDQRIADLAGDLCGLFGAGDGFLGARHARNSGLLREAAGGGLVAQQVEQVGRGPDEGDAGALAGAGQGRVLGEEAVARVDGVDAFFLGERDDAFDIEVGFHRPFAFADQVGFVGFEAVQGEAVFLGIDGDGAQAEFIGGAEDADGDFAAIQCKKFFHGWRAWKIVCFLRITGGMRGCGGWGRPGVAPRSGAEPGESRTSCSAPR